MRRAIVEVIALAIAVAGLTIFLAASAAAGPRFGPGPLLGLVTLPLSIIGHHGVVRGGPALHHRAAHSTQSATQSATQSTPLPTPGPRDAQNPPVAGSSPAPSAADPSIAPPAPAGSTPPPTVEARADHRPAAEPPPITPTPPALWPIASPGVYADLLGYILWPADYADQIWTHGYGDIMNTLLAPMTGAASADRAASMLANGMCSIKADELADRLIEHTREMIAPTPPQQAGLDEVSAAVREAIERGRAEVCTGTGNPLKRTQDGLWTMWDATLLLRPALEKFYRSLDDAQKAKLAGGAAAGQALARACADQHPTGSDDRLEQALRAGGQQRVTLEALRLQSSELIKFLAISCPQEIEPTPMDRLHAAGERLNALLYVAMSMSAAVNELYGSVKAN